VPWKSSLNGYEHTRNGLHKIQEQVKAAKTIVVGGAGPTGVETAAELGFEYGKAKEITLVTAGNELLVDSMPTNIAQGAENTIKKMHVNVVKGVKVLSSTPTADGKTELSLDNGENMIVDLYLPTIGVIPNTEYVPKNLLDDKGQVVVDEFLRVKATEDIWAAGDLTSLDFAQIVYTEKQATAAAKNLDLVLKGKEPVAYKSGGGRIMALALGRSKATGRSGDMKIPSLVIWWLSMVFSAFL
jgi:NADH dehydrogenase FAD-containing subunit